MADDTFRVFTGGTFQFDVAEHANTFVLHSELVSQHSPVFHALMHSQMKESQENRTRLNNVDSDTFARFAEFIYSGDYNTAEARIVLDDVDPLEATPSIEVDYPYPNHPPKKLMNRQKNHLSGHSVLHLQRNILERGRSRFESNFHH